MKIGAVAKACLRHPGLDPGSPGIARIRGLRVKPAMTEGYFATALFFLAAE